MEFNPDGSLKIGGAAGTKVAEESRKMANLRCVKVTKNVTRSFAPKECRLILERSRQVEPDFIERTFKVFSSRVQTSMKIQKISAVEYEISVGNEFSRCRDCRNFVFSLREYLGSNNLIEKKGTCTFKGDFY